MTTPRTHPKDVNETTMLRVGRRRSGGYSLLELSVALGVFLLLASVVSLAVAQAMVTQSSVRTHRVVAAAVTDGLEQLSKASYDDLLADTFLPPNQCPGEDPSIDRGTKAHSCITLGDQDYRVSYSTSIGEDAVGTSSSTGSYVDVTATVSLADGSKVEQVRRVPAPSVGYAPNTGVVRVVLSGETAELKGAVYLLKADGSVAAASKPSAAGVVLLRSSAAACTPAAPCTLSASPSGAKGAVGISAEGGTVVLTKGGLVEAGARVFRTGSLEISLFAQSDTAAISGPNEVKGSVCLWGSFVDGTVKRVVPFCNTSEASKVLVSEYAPDPASPARKVPVPTDTPITLTVDRPDGTCPEVPGMVGSTASGWVPAAVCTSWSWGRPAMFGPFPGTLVAWDDPIVKLSPAVNSTYRALWSGAGARPAAGYTNEPVWSKPRQAAGCAFDATCVSFNTSVPEAQECPGKHCLSATNFRPELPAPRYGTYQVPVVPVESAKTNLGIRVVDRDGDAMKVVLTKVPASGGVRRISGGSDLPVGTVLAEGGTGELVVDAAYRNPPGQTTTESLEIEVTDGKTGGVSRFEIGVYVDLETWQVRPEPVTAFQGDLNVPVKLFAVGVNGEARSGGTLNVTSVPAGMTASTTSVVTDTAGNAQFTLNVGNVKAGTHNVTLTAAGSGRTQNIPVVVKQTPHSLDLTATGAAQGAKGTVGVKTLDRAGDPVVGVNVSVVAVKGGEVATGVYPEFAGCVTGTDGACSVPLVVEATAAAGTYSVQAASGDFTKAVDVTVTSAPYTVQGNNPAVLQGESGPLVVTVKDGTGVAMGGVPVTFTSSTTGLTVASATATTDPNGMAQVTVSAAADLAAGTARVSVAAGSKTTPLPVSVKQKAALVTAAGTVTVKQGAETSTWVTVKDGAGALMPGANITFSVAAVNGEKPSVSPQATTSSDGRATAGVGAASDLTAGTYTVTATAGSGAKTTFSVVVEQVLASVVTQGGVLAGKTGTVTFVAYDGAGDPIPSRGVTATSSSLGVTLKATTTDVNGAVQADISAVDDAAGLYTVELTIDGRKASGLVMVS